MYVVLWWSDAEFRLLGNGIWRVLRVENELSECGFVNEEVARNMVGHHFPWRGWGHGISTSVHRNYGHDMQPIAGSTL